MVFASSKKGGKQQNDGRKGGRRSGGAHQEKKSEFDQSILDIRRTTRVVAGGRRFSFRASVALGNRNGKVGIGTGKGADVARAIEKAVFQARKHMMMVPMKKYTIPHEASAKFAASRVMLKPARDGRGLVAGGPVRIIVTLAGIRDLTAKIVSRSSNKLNNAKATMRALEQLRTPITHNAEIPTAKVENKDDVIQTADH